MTITPALYRGMQIFLLISLCVVLSPHPKQQAQTNTSPPTGLNVLSIPYYSIKGDWESTLTLTCAWHEPLTASLTVFSLDGSALPLSDFHLDPYQTMPLRLSDLITHVPERGQFQEGSVELRYNGPALAIGAQLTVEDFQHSLSFDMEPPTAPFKSSTLEGLWWSLDEKTEGQMMISNRAIASVTVLPTVQWQGTPRPAPALALAPHQTVVVEVSKLLKDLNIDTKGIGLGGLSLAHNGPPGAVIVHGVIVNKDTGFSSNLNFIDPAAQQSSAIEGAGLMLGHPADAALRPAEFFTPVLVLKNITQSPQTVGVTVQYSVSGSLQLKTLPEITVGPHEVRMADFSSLLSELQGVAVDDAGMKIDSAGLPGSIVAQLTSIDQAASMSVDVPLLPAANGFIGTGAHPFVLAGGKHAILHLKNTGDRQTTAIVQIRYGGGEFSPELIHIAPGQSVAIDLRQLRDSQAPDIHGHKLPADLTSGQVHWFQHGDQSVTGHLSSLNVLDGVAATFACPNTCCPPSFYFFSSTPSSIDGELNAQFDVFLFETLLSNCSSVTFGPYPVSSWTLTSPDTTVATVSDHLVTMAGPGVVTLTAKADTTSYSLNFFDCSPEAPCPASCSFLTQPETLPIIVISRPLVTSIDGPRLLTVGTVGNQITLTAAGKPAGGSFRWSSTSNRVNLAGTNSSTLTVSGIMQSGLPNDVLIQVTYTANGVESFASIMFLTVQRPASIGLIGTTLSGPAECSPDSAGPDRTVIRQVLDQFGQPMRYAGMFVGEVVIILGPNTCLVGQILTGSQLTDATGSFLDRFFLCSTVCKTTGSCETVALQTITVDTVSDLNFLLDYTCAGITVNGQ